MPPLVDIFVPGLPQTKGSAKGFGFVRKHGPRAGKIGVAITNDNKKAKPWAAVITLAAREAMAGRAAVSGPVSVAITFYLPRPKKHFTKRGLRPEAPRFVTKKPDGDKMVRCCWDAMKNVVFGDDAQVADWPGRKLYANPGEAVGARIVVSALVEPAVELLERVAG